MRPGVSHLLKLCVLGEFYARFSQDAQVNETLETYHSLKILSSDYAWNMVKINPSPAEPGYALSLQTV